MMMHRCIDDFHLEQKQQQQHEEGTGLPPCHFQDHHDGDLKIGMVIIMVIMAQAEQEGSI